jgi:hypothetical protein
MWRRLNRGDLEGSNPLLADEEFPRPWPVRWRVYEDYEILPAPDGSDWRYIQAMGRNGGGQPKCVHSYNPLIDTPYLFLEFARITERRDPFRALLDWFERYGLLGMTEETRMEDREHWKGMNFPQVRHDDRGGPADRIEVIWELAHQYNESLVLYEAVLSRDEGKLEHALFPEHELEYAEVRRHGLEEKAEASGASWTDVLVNSALHQVIEYASGDLYIYAYPHIVYPDEEFFTVEGLTRGWGARNLLGAMGLQFYWLITSAGELAHCQHCGRIISYAPPIPSGENRRTRKPRTDKKFCDDRCRQNYHYHNRIKPDKNSEQC